MILLRNCPSSIVIFSYATCAASSSGIAKYLSEVILGILHPRNVAQGESDHDSDAPKTACTSFQISIDVRLSRAEQSLAAMSKL